MADRDRAADERSEDDRRKDERREEERINPPGLGPIERSRPRKGGEPDTEKQTDWEAEEPPAK